MNSINIRIPATIRIVAHEANMLFLGSFIGYLVDWIVNLNSLVSNGVRQ